MFVLLVLHLNFTITSSTCSDFDQALKTTGWLQPTGPGNVVRYHDPDIGTVKKPEGQLVRELLVVLLTFHKLL